jgi:hypothetical protein
MVAAALDLLRRHIADGPERLAGRRQLRPAAEELGDPEVEHLDEVTAVAAPDAEAILRLHVAVDHARGMGSGQRVADLQRDPSRARPRQRPFAAQQSPQVLAGQQFHHIVGNPLTLPYICDLDDVLVTERRQHPHLALKSLDRVGPTGEVVVQELHGPPLAQPDMCGEVHAAHPALAEALADPIAAVEQATLPTLRLASARHAR